MSSVTDHRTRSMKEGQSAAKYLRKNVLMRKLDRYRYQGGPSRDFPMAVDALLEYVNDQEVTDAWRKGLPKEDEA